MNADTFKGKTQERYGDRKDELETWADKWHGETRDTAKLTDEETSSIKRSLEQCFL